MVETRSSSCSQAFSNVTSLSGLSPLLRESRLFSSTSRRVSARSRCFSTFSRARSSSSRCPSFKGYSVPPRLSCWVASRSCWCSSLYRFLSSCPRCQSLKSCSFSSRNFCSLLLSSTGCASSMLVVVEGRFASVLFDIVGVLIVWR